MPRLLLDQVLIWTVLILASKGLPGQAISCFNCTKQCIKFDPSAENQRQKCPDNVKHCVNKKIHSKVTGVVLEERYCGGAIYNDDLLGKLKQCFQEEPDPEKRTFASYCYCTSDLCNASSLARLSGIFMLLNAIVYLWL